MIRFVLLLTLLLAAFALGGCGHGYVGAYVGPPPPQPYVVGPVGVGPGPGYLWNDGFWDLRGGKWAWSNGHWARPPHSGYHWEAPRWEHRGNRYHFRRGHWHR
jgi:hypothetical protein